MWQVLIKLVEKWAYFHEWKLYNRTEVYGRTFDLKPYETKDTLICEKCGKIKRIKL